MHMILAILTLAAILGLGSLIRRSGATEKMKSLNTKQETESVERAGRIGLWVLFPPLGFWRSYKHGADRRNEKLAEMINRREE